MMVPKRDNKHTTDTSCNCNPVRYNPADPDQTRLAEQVLTLQKEIEKLYTALPTLPVPLVEKIKSCLTCPLLTLQDGIDMCNHPQGTMLYGLTAYGNTIHPDCPLTTAPLLIMAEGPLKK